MANDEQEMGIEQIHAQVVMCQLAMVLLMLKAGGNTTFTFIRITSEGIVIGTENLGAFQVQLEAIT